MRHIRHSPGAQTFFEIDQRKITVGETIRKITSHQNTAFFAKPNWHHRWCNCDVFALHWIPPLFTTTWYDHLMTLITANLDNCSYRRRSKYPRMSERIQQHHNNQSEQVQLRHRKSTVQSSSVLKYVLFPSQIHRTHSFYALAPTYT